MENIVFTLEFDDIESNERANEYLKKGWKLLHVRTKLVSSFGDDRADYETAYVVGADKSQYEQYKLDLKKDELDFKKHFKDIL